MGNYQSPDSQLSKNRQKIGFNLLFIVENNLTGPGYYAVQLFENILELALKQNIEVIGYIQPVAAKHFSKHALKNLRLLRNFGNRFSRVAYEQAFLPRHSRRDRLAILFSPAFVSPLWGAPHLAVTICDMYYRAIPELIEKAQRWYWQVLIPPSARKCDLIITISQNSKRDIERFIPSARGKTVSIPLASRFAPLSTSNVHMVDDGPNPFVLMVANLTVNKNCEVVVQAMDILRREGLELEFVHVGSDHLGLLERAVAHYDASGYVRSLGKVSDETLAANYRSCLCAVVPSLYEGFAMPVLEAQAHGAPLVCSNRSAVPEVAGDDALFFDPDDAQALARHLRQLYHDRALRERIGKAGIINAGLYSWEQTAAATLKVFQDMLRNSNHATDGKFHGRS